MIEIKQTQTPTRTRQEMLELIMEKKIRFVAAFNRRFDTKEEFGFEFVLEDFEMLYEVYTKTMEEEGRN